MKIITVWCNEKWIFLEREDGKQSQIPFSRETLKEKIIELVENQGFIILRWLGNKEVFWVYKDIIEEKKYKRRWINVVSKGRGTGKVIISKEVVK